MPKVTPAIEEEDYESSMEIDPFSLFINAKEQNKLKGNIKPD